MQRSRHRTDWHLPDKSNPADALFPVRWPVDASRAICSIRARGEDLRGAPNVSEAAPSITAPEPGSATELAIFRDLQLRLPDLFRKVFPDPRAPRTVVIIPSAPRH